MACGNSSTLLALRSSSSRTTPLSVSRHQVFGWGSTAYRGPPEGPRVGETYDCAHEEQPLCRPMFRLLTQTLSPGPYRDAGGQDIVGVQPPSFFRSHKALPSA